MLSSEKYFGNFLVVYELKNALGIRYKSRNLFWVNESFEYTCFVLGAGKHGEWLEVEVVFEWEIFLIFFPVDSQ